LCHARDLIIATEYCALHFACCDDEQQTVHQLSSTWLLMVQDYQSGPLWSLDVESTKVNPSRFDRGGNQSLVVSEPNT
jgi:hypothetical protein